MAPISNRLISNYRWEWKDEEKNNFFPNEEKRSKSFILVKDPKKKDVSA